MSNESPYWGGFRQIRLPLGWWKWERLPRHPAYKYEYFDGKALLTPRPKSVDMVLDMSDWHAPAPTGEVVRSRRDVRIRAIGETDWTSVEEAFYRAFAGDEPFKSLSRCRARALTADCLRHTRGGGDGELIDKACFLAESVPDGEHASAVRGAVVVTLVRSPDVPSLAGVIKSPDDRVAHLTWIFVARLDARHGIGTYLLERTVKQLRSMGHQHLTSTTFLGNDASLLWHWRNGFQLLSRGFSTRVAVQQQ